MEIASTAFFLGGLCGLLFGITFNPKSFVEAYIQLDEYRQKARGKK